jgi:dihydrofolate reductase
MKRRIILYIATSSDGFIAGKDGSIKFLDKYNESGEDYGYKEFFSSIQSIIFGNNTYQQVGNTKEFKEWYKNTPIFVFSKKLKGKKDNVTFVNEDVKEFAEKLEGDVWMMGGASILDAFLKEDLIDEFIITIMPDKLGEGIPLFKEKDFEKQLKLIDTKKYSLGAIQKHYTRP